MVFGWAEEWCRNATWLFHEVVHAVSQRSEVSLAALKSGLVIRVAARTTNA